jgi:hypothetical protein
MTAIEHQELKGITVKNLVVTVVSTASIVASVMTTYFGLKSDIQSVRSSQEVETRINNVRIKVLENQVALLQKEMDGIKIFGQLNPSAAKRLSPAKMQSVNMLSAIEK